MTYEVTACKEVNSDGEWIINSVVLRIQAENETDAEWEVRNLGYSPLFTKTTLSNSKG